MVSGLNKIVFGESGISFVSFEILHILKQDQLSHSWCMPRIDCIDKVYSYDECSHIGFELAGGAGCPSPGGKRHPGWAKDRTFAAGDESCAWQTARLARRSVTREDRRAYGADPARSVLKARRAGCARGGAR